MVDGEWLMREGFDGLIGGIGCFEWWVRGLYDTYNQPE